MTREELETIRSTVKRSEKSLATLDALALAKAANLNLAIKPLCDWNTGTQLLDAALALRVMRLGIDALVAQLEQELAGISVAKPKASPFVFDERSTESVENLRDRGLEVPIYPGTIPPEVGQFMVHETHSQQEPIP